MHCEFSDDSRTPMEEQIRRAIELGMDEICFTDHVDYGIKKDWTENGILCRGGDGVSSPISERTILANVNYPEYFGKLLRMRKTFGDQITIRAGLEFGIQTHTIPSFRKLIDKYGDLLDFVLLSIHQVEDKEFWTGDFMAGRTREEYNLRYYEEMLRVISEFKDFNVLAHVDLISRYDPEGAYPFEKIEGILTKIFELVIAEGKGIEINTSSWHYGLPDTTPSRRILQLYYDMGGRIITMGSDAHVPKYLGDHFDDAKEVLKEIGFTQFCTFVRGKPAFHSL